MRALATAAILATQASIGCAALDRADIIPPPFSAGPLRPAIRSVAVDELVRAPGTVATYRIFEGKRKGATIEQRVERRDEEVHVVEILRAPGKPAEPSEEMRFSQAAGGSLLLREVITHAEKSASLFNDGLAFAAALSASAPVLEGASDMRVLTLPKRTPRGSGRATRSLRLAGEATVTISGAPVDTSVLDLVFDIDLDVAKAHVTARLYVAEGRGVVAEERTEELRVLGIFPRKTVEHTVLTHLEPSP
ncbi:MAG: hypothetical protein RIT24_2193 [Planctomycetota bacterium]|jgi:hypothetical protein